jgi:general secretion pathway protein G
MKREEPETVATRLSVLHLIFHAIQLEPKRQGGRCKAFTLIELLIVIGLIGILLAIAIPSYLSQVNKAKNVVAISDIREIGNEIVDYMLERGELPDSLADVGWENRSDSWGNPYEFLKIDSESQKGKGKGKVKPRKDQFGDSINSDFDLYSMGRDRQSKDSIQDEKSLDDIIRASNGGYIGLVSKWRHFQQGKGKGKK